MVDLGQFRLEPSHPGDFTGHVAPWGQARAAGGRRRDGRRWVARATATAEGRSTAAAAMLFMKRDKNAAVSIRPVARRVSLSPMERSRRIPSQWVTPVCSRAKVRMNIARMVMTADWLKPAKARSEERRVGKEGRSR